MDEDVQELRALYTVVCKCITDWIVLQAEFWELVSSQMFKLSSSFFLAVGGWFKTFSEEPFWCSLKKPSVPHICDWGRSVTEAGKKSSSMKISQLNGQIPADSNLAWIFLGVAALGRAKEGYKLKYVGGRQQNHTIFLAVIQNRNWLARNMII
jgi:hypothetical protein